MDKKKLFIRRLKKKIRKFKEEYLESKLFWFSASIVSLLSMLIEGNTSISNPMPLIFFISWNIYLYKTLGKL